MESSFDNLAESSLPLVPTFFPNNSKKVADFQKKFTKLSLFFRKTFSPEKVPLENWKSNFDDAFGIFLPNIDYFPLNVRKKTLNNFRSKKHAFFLNEFIWTQGRTFEEYAGNFPKKTWITARIRKMSSYLIFFRGKIYFPWKRPPGSIKSNFDNFADFFLPEFQFFHENLKKTSLEIWIKLLNCLCSSRKKISWNSSSGQIESNFENRLKFHCQSKTIFCSSSDKTS